jgi:hypothetical protein
MTQVTLIPGRPAVTKIVEPATPDQVQITMDRKTAEVLMLILARVGGNPRDSLRGETDKVWGALSRAGVGLYGHKAGTLMADTTSQYMHTPASISFKDGAL